MPIKAAACPHQKPFSRFILPLVSTPWLRQACEPNTHSTLSAVQPLAHKSDTGAVVKSTLTMLETQTGYRTKRLRCDNGSEYINADLKAFCDAKGIKLETTVRYTPEQNGAAERLNRTLMDKVRPMLAGTGMHKHLWAVLVVIRP